MDLKDALISVNDVYEDLVSAVPRLAMYADRTLALVADLEYRDGEFETLHLSVNLSQYGQFPEAGHVFVPDYSESKGKAKALELAGIGKIVEPISIGFGSGFVVEVVGLW